MANKKIDRLGGESAAQSAAPSGRVQVLNLAQLRAEKSRQRPVIVDQNGKEHDLGGISLDGYLAMLEFEQVAEQMRSDEGDNRQAQVDMIQRMRATITALMPDFPVGELYLDELMMVAQAMQAAVMPGGATEVSGDAQPGN